MNRSLTFGRVVARVVFVLGLFLVLAGPQLVARHPGPGFAELQELLRPVSVLGWLLIVLTGSFGLFLLAGFLSWRTASLAGSSGAGNVPAATLPISEAVNTSHGGNGLASAPFKPFLPFINMAGWLEVKEPDKECLVIDAQSVVRSTRFYIAPMRLLGKPLSARRILLSPAPLTDVSAKALTSDQLELTLVVSVKYDIANPAYVASLQAPLAELTNLITGVVAEYIRSDTLANIVKDDGTLRQQLKQGLENSPSMRGRYNIGEVLKALPTGDERILEIIRKTREAVQKEDLIRQEGKNKRLEADYAVLIDRARAELHDEFAKRQHERDMEMGRMQQEFEVQRELMRTIGAIAASGINPTAAIHEIRALMLGTRQEAPVGLPPQSEPGEDRLAFERQSLGRIQAALGFKHFDLRPHRQYSSQPGSAEVEFDDFTVFVDCPTDYPHSAPSVRLKLREEEAVPVTVPWREGGNLVDATTAAVMQARATVDDQTNGG